jgi:hypothetical protein
MFTQFIDERSLHSMAEDRLTDITFFDESIDAKMNRYMFNLQKIDTPFLLDDARRHIKTFVPPTPNTDNLPRPLSQGETEGGESAVTSSQNTCFRKLK